MRFDLVPLYSPGEKMEWNQVVAQMEEETRLAQDIGMTGVWVGEHHFGTPHVDNGATNPITLCAHLAARCDRIRVGQIPIVLPDHHPLRVAEELAMLDQMTHGRAEAGFGRGTNDRACIQFNPNADRRDDERNYRLYLEQLDIIVGAWTQDAFTHKGEFYEFPVPGWKEQNDAFRGLDTRYYASDGELIALDVRPKPYQKPHPPVYLASEKLKTHEYAAERGFGMLSWSVHRDRDIENWGRYAEIASRAEGRTVKPGERMGVMQVIYCAPTMAEAIADCRYGVNQQWAFSTGSRPGVWARKWWLPNGVDPTPEQMDQDWFDFLQALDCVWVGTPEYVAEKLAKWHNDVGLEHVIMWPQLFALPHEKVMRSMELFAAHVMPLFQEKPLVLSR